VSDPLLDEARRIVFEHWWLGRIITPLMQRVEEAERENERMRKALEEIAKSGGWQTVWCVDEAEPERGKQPSIFNIADELARQALSDPAGEERE
jgi:hypothetical protein